VASPDKTPLASIYEQSDGDWKKADDLFYELEAEVVRLQQAQRQATHYLESYCESTDPDPRADDDEEITVPDAYVLSALAALAEGDSVG